MISLVEQQRLIVQVEEYFSMPSSFELWKSMEEG